MRDIDNAGNVAMTLRHGQSVSLVHPDGTVCVVAPTPKQVGKCHIVIIAPKAVRIERDKETADEIERLRAERDEARLLAIALQVQQQHESGHPNYLKETEWQTGRRIARERGWDCFKEGT